ncbi:MAG TPA: hypothetical protein VJ990_01940 [Clostridia bacterium]|nr:hypothetical protein [Clostridia bacterium]
MKKSRMLIIIAIIIAIPLSVYGVRYYKNTMPQVGDSEALEMLAEYKTELESGYGELQDAFKLHENDETNEKWMGFSREWFVSLGEAKPENLSKRMSSALEKKKDALIAVDGKMLELWKEYNGNFSKGKLDEEAVEQDIMIIEGVLEKLKIE